MKNDTCVCWKCQIGNRNGSETCQVGGRPMQRLMDKFRIPKKGKTKEWNALKELVVNYNDFYRRGYQAYLERKSEAYAYKLMHAEYERQNHERI